MRSIARAIWNCRNVARWFSLSLRERVRVRGNRPWKTGGSGTLQLALGLWILAVSGLHQDAASVTGEFQMGDSKDCPFWFIRQALNFPAVGQDDLLHHCEPQAGAL